MMLDQLSESVQDPARWLLAAYGSAFADVLEFTSGERPDVSPAQEPEHGAAVAGERQVTWWEQKTSLGADAVLWVGSTSDAWQELGRRGLLAAGVEDAGDDEVRATYNEVLQQSLASLAQQIGARVASEVTCSEANADASAPDLPAFRLDFEYPDSSRLKIYIAAAPALLAALAPDAAPAGMAQPALAPSGAAAESESPAVVAPPASGPRTADLLLDVELPVSVSFGRVHLPLRDVLKLTSGSIVELNRAVSEPVEVIVNNCVIARGEVVVVEGNYGVRVSQIISRRDRLRTLN